MIDYYELDILCTGFDEKTNTFYEFDRIVKEFEFPSEATAWLKSHYEGVKFNRGVMWDEMERAGYMYEFENADWSHAPVEKWLQRDFVHIGKVRWRNAFEEVAYEVPVLQR